MCIYETSEQSTSWFGVSGTLLGPGAASVQHSTGVHASSIKLQRSVSANQYLLGFDCAGCEI